MLNLFYDFKKSQEKFPDIQKLIIMKTKIITLVFLFTFILYANETPKYPALFSDESVRNTKVKQLL